MEPQLWRDHYNRTAGMYDWKESLWSLLLGYSDHRERQKLVRLLQLKPGQRLLEVSVGTGTNLELAADGVSGLKMVGLDISIGMLLQCWKKLTRHGLRADLVEGEAARLPFEDDVFDAVLHFGGISQFGDKKAAIDEMVRVARPGARIVVGDVGLGGENRESLRGKLLLRVNSRYASQPPLESIPPAANDLHVNWFRGDTCYLIDFVKPRSPVATGSGR